MNSLKEIRSWKGFSQHDLADKTGLSVSTISRYETGKRKIPIKSAKKMGEVLSVNWVSFYDDSER